MARAIKYTLYAIIFPSHHFTLLSVLFLDGHEGKNVTSTV